jgi:cobalt-zinc-cadmium efflux system membrane fusion protein
MTIVEFRRRLPWLILGGLVLVIVALFGSGRLTFKSANPSAKEAEEGEKSAGAVSERVNRNVVRLAGAEASLAELKIEPAQEHDLPTVVTLPGEVQVADNRLARVTPSVAGVVRSVEKAAGDSVAKGGILCALESPELGDARAAYVEALSERDFAERNYDRWKVLYEKGLRTQNELYAAESDLTKTKIKAESGESKLRALGTGVTELERLKQQRAEAVNNRFTVVSPVGGFVLDRAVTPGQSVTTQDQLFQVADLSTVWVVAAAHESDLRSIRSGLKATVAAPAEPGARSPIPGIVLSVGPQTDEKTRTIQVRIVVKNPMRSSSPLLRPGAFTTMTIELPTKRRAVAVPKAALQTDGPDSFVFVRSPERPNEGQAFMTFERRPVSPGMAFGDLVEIREGLKPGEEVVTKNGYLLKAEMQKMAPED